MFYVSEISTTAPKTFKTPLQQQVYLTLAQLGVPFQRVDTDEAITMEDCVAIDRVLEMKMVKTLFLANRQQTGFWLFVTAGDKPFRAKDFAAALQVARPSFAPAPLMETMLGTRIGAATVLSALLPQARDVQVVLDRSVVLQPWYGCSDGTTTCYLKLKTDDLLHRILPAAGCSPAVIEV